MSGLYDYQLFLEDWIRPVMALHGVAAVITCAALTHHVIDTARMMRGRYGLARRVRRFALISMLGYLATFTLGALIYPAYRYEVRDQVFERPGFETSPPEFGAEAGGAGTGGVPAVSERSLSERAARQHPDLRKWSGRFDVKENWASIALATMAAMFVLSRVLEPRRDRGWMPVYLALSGITALVVWFNVLLGLMLVMVKAP